MKALLALLCIIRAVAQAQVVTSHLDEDDVWLLVMNIPEVMAVEARKGCPHVELSREGQDLPSALVRNACPEKLPASGTIGLYTIDLRRGRIWRGIDRVQLVESERLRRLRAVLLLRHEPRAEAAPLK